MRSPASSTGASSTTACTAALLLGAARRGLATRCCTSTSTSSRWSTTPAATRPATGCCATSPACCRRACAPPTPSRAWAAMSSACCSEGCTLEQATRIADGVRQAIRDFRFVWGAQHALGGREHRHRADPRRDRERRERHVRGRHRLLRGQGCRPQPHPRLRAPTGVSHRHREMHWVARVTRAAEDNRLELFFQPIVSLHATAAGAPSTSSPCACAMTTASWCRRPSSSRPPSATTSCRRSTAGWWSAPSSCCASAGARASALPLLAVNLSGTSLNEQSFVDFVLQSVGEPAIAGALCFEITETAAVTSLVQRALPHERAQGARLQVLAR